MLAPATHVLEQRLDARRRRGIGRRNDGRRQRGRELLAELHAPLIEWIDVPDHALHEDLVLVPRNETAEHAWREPRKQHQADRPVAGLGLMCSEPRELRFLESLVFELGPHLFERLTERKCLGLGKTVGEREILLPLQTTRSVDWREQVEREARIALVQQLEERVLRVVARLAPD